MTRFLRFTTCTDQCSPENGHACREPPTSGGSPKYRIPPNVADLAEQQATDEELAALTGSGSETKVDGMTIVEFLTARFNEAHRDAMNDAVADLLTIREDVDSVRGPGWYEGECVNEDWNTSGYESVVEDVGWEHVAQAHPLANLALREVEAKRLIMAEHKPIGAFCETCSDGYHGFDCDGGWDEPWPCPTLRVLAVVYADHPAFDPAWAVTA